MVEIWMVKRTKRESGHYWRYKEYNQILRMQAVVLTLVSSYILSMAESTPMVQNKEQRSNKYLAHLSHCGVLGKIQLLQITETGDERSEEGEIASLRETYVLSPRKLKKTSGATWQASVSKLYSSRTLLRRVLRDCLQVRCLQGRD